MTYDIDIRPIIQKFEEEVKKLELKHENTNSDNFAYMDDWVKLHKILKPIAHLIPLKEQQRLQVSHWINDWDNGKIVKEPVEWKDKQ